jgi:4-hydroxy-tetrahydrodipicolinate synthase
MKISDIRQNSLITAIKTPFDKSGNIDIDAYNYLIERQIKLGVDGLIICGTTGEGHLLSWEEHLGLIQHAVKNYGNQIMIAGNTGSNNTREAVRATEKGFESGMHLGLQINPYYSKTTQQGIKRHLQSSLDVGPVMVYNVDARTGQDISPDVMRELAEHENFVGVKECAGNDRIGLYESEGIACWSGNDDQCFDARHKFNGHGVVSVVSNLVPGLMRMLMDKNDDALNQSLLPLIDWLFCEPNPIALNTALGMLGAITPVFRLPYLPLDKLKQEQGLSLLAEIKREHLPGDKLELIVDNALVVI